MRGLLSLLAALGLMLRGVRSEIGVGKCCGENEGYDLSSRRCSPIRESQTERRLNAPELVLMDYEQNLIPISDFHYSSLDYLKKAGKDCGDREYFVNSPPGDYDDEDLTEDVQWFLIQDEPLTVVLKEDFRLIQKDFCVDRGYSSTGKHLGNILAHCFSWEKACLEKTCIRTDCLPEFVFNDTTLTCEYSAGKEDFKWSVNVLDEDGTPINESQILFRVEGPRCSQYHVYNAEEESYSIDKRGVIAIANGKYDNSKYKMTRVKRNNRQTGELEYVTIIGVCVEKVGYKGYLSYGRYLWTMFLVVCQCLSMIFLLLLLGYLMKTNRRKLFGILTMCMTSSLFFFYLFLALTQALHETLVIKFPTLCIIIGFLVQFSYQTSIFWLNAMCFDIWCTFRYIQRASEFEPPGWKKPIFKLYCLYAWGIPSLISVITVTMNFLPKDLTQNVITPGIGINSCFFSTNIATLLYFHLINCVAIIANVVFFTGSSWNLLCGVWADGGNEDPFIRKQNRIRYKAVFKLFFAMGISWLAEVVSWVIGWAVGTHSDTVIYGSAFFDVVNALQGMTIFIVLVFDSSNITKIRNFFSKYRTTDPHNGSLAQRSSTPSASVSSFKKGNSNKKFFRKETPPTRQEHLEMKKEDFGRKFSSP